jgi:hypothetical protein
MASLAAFAPESRDESGEDEGDKPKLASKVGYKELCRSS